MLLTFAGCGQCNTPTPQGSDLVLNLSQSGSALSGSGSMTVTEAPPAGCAADPNCNQGPIGLVIPLAVTGTVSGSTVAMQWSGTVPGPTGISFVINATGTVAGNRMSGTATFTSPSVPTAQGTWAVNLQ
jgi:hypothetical protein